MDAIMEFWNTLGSNVVLLLFLMPMIGAVLVRLMSSSGAEPVSLTGLTNVWITAGLAVVLMIRFDHHAADPDDPGQRFLAPQLVTSLPWVVQQPSRPPRSAGGPGNVGDIRSSASDAAGLGIRRPTVGPDIRLAVGVNGLSLWPIVIVVATTLGCAHSLPRSDPRFASRMAALLMSEATLIGLYAAADVILLGACLQAAPLSLFFLMGDSGNAEQREGARRFLRVQMVSGMLITVGLVGLAISHYWMMASTSEAVPYLSFSTDRIRVAIPIYTASTDAAHGLWQAVSPWLFVCICGGIVLRVPLPPFHRWWFWCCANDRPWATAMLTAGTVPIAFFLGAGILQPIFGDVLTGIGPRLLLWAVGVALFAGLMTLPGLDRTNLPPGHFRVASAGLLIAALSFAAVCAGDVTALSGGLLLSTGAAASLGLWYLLCPLINPPGTRGPAVDGSSGEVDTPGPQTRSLTVSAMLLLSLAGLSQLPPAGSFWGAFLLLQSLFRSDSTLALWLVVVIVIVPIAFAFARPDSLDATLRTVSPSRPPTGSPPTGSPPTGSPPTGSPPIIALVPLTLLILYAGLNPQSVTGRAPASASVSRSASAAGSASTSAETNRIRTAD